MQARAQRIIINEVDVTGLCAQGLVYRFDQREELVCTYFHDGLCLGFTASLMRQLLNENFTAIQNYSSPLPQPILRDAVSLLHNMIDCVRDGHDINTVIFDGRRVSTIKVKPECMPQVLHNLEAQNGATVTYTTTSNNHHVLLFFKKRNDRCVVQDVNRFTADEIELASGIKIVKEIVDRSHPESVEICYTDRRLRARL